MLRGLLSRTFLPLILACIMGSEMAAAQQPEAEEPPPPADLYTLHVYTNLIQIPTLILGLNKKSPPIPRDKFNITLDGGPIFHPTQMRLQGEDAVSYAVIIDAGGEQSYFVSDIGKQLSRLAPNFIRAKDTISIYAIDCKTFGTAAEIPGEPQAIEEAVARVLASPGLHGEKRKHACGNSLHLWDTLASAATALGKLPGRRVLLLISQGHDHGSNISFEEMMSYISFQGAAVFGLRDREELTTYQSLGDRDANPRVSGEMLYRQLCERNGGAIYSIHHFEITQTLQDWITALRGRYIIEFPRPDEGTAGMHSISVTVPSKPQIVLRTTGATAPVADHSLRDDPNTLKTSDSPARFGSKPPPQPKGKASPNL